MDYLNLTIRPEITPSKELQKHLTAALRARTSDTLVRSADPAAKARLESLLTPHMRRHGLRARRSSRCSPHTNLFLLCGEFWE